jgi:FkbM family methyltransferase
MASLRSSTVPAGISRERIAGTIRLGLFASPATYSAARRAVQLVRYLRRQPHEPDFAAFARFRARPGLFLDVGANSGTSALSFRIFDAERPILSIEPNALLAPELRFVGRVVGNFRFLIGAAGEHDEELTLFVPIYRGVPITGAASLDREVVADHSALRAMVGDRVASSDFQIEPQRVRVHRLDDLDLHPAIVKIDVEGEELAVVRGLAETIARDRPVLMVEYARHHAAIAALLAEQGYAPCTFLPEENRLVPFIPRRSRNVFFLPPDVERPHA